MKRLALLLVMIFAVAGMNIFAQDMMGMDTINLGGNDELGTFFVDAEGNTLYIFTNDAPGVSNCTGGCAENWPPLTVAEGEQPSLAAGISGEVRVITREDGLRHVTYNGTPLYTWVRDEAPGDATGQGVNDVWFVATTPDVGLGGNEELGQFLVDAAGNTLYIFTNDEAGVSNCSGGCAENWPPLSVDSADSLTLQPGLAGEFGVIEREDGSLHVTLNDAPLYTWVRDEAPGDATGQAVNDVWFVAKLPTIAVAETEEFGAILTGPNGLSLYTFTNDEAGVSACVDGCAVAWPPLTVAAGEEVSVAVDIEGVVGTIERTDGSLQVTYNDAPLYYWINDIAPGDTSGHEVREVWFLAQP